MIDWRRGGWTGSLNTWVRREVSDQLRHNPTSRRVRYGFAHRAFRWFFGIGTVARFAGAYVLIDMLFVFVEALSARPLADWLPSRIALDPLPGPAVESVLLNVSNNLITAQVGLLGVISLALAL